MASVDDRVVAMQFDNKAFEDRIATTISSLDKLKSTINNASKTKGLDNLQQASNKFNLHGISDALEGISSKFTAMGAVAFTVLQNVVNRAVDTGIRLGKSLSLDQVISGFREYETNLNSIQTVLANTSKDGTTLKDVNAALDQLNTYSDQTIYNFGQMARNIGTFTAAGVKLDVSTAAIKGIANLAAVSGSNADQASTAMYQLSQALASGRVKLMDWNSVVNAGLGGKVFQEALFNTGQALGTIKNVPIGQTFQQWTDAGHTFRDSLEQGWITSEVLTNTLQGFTGDLTEAQIRAMGYTEAQTADILAMGKTAKEAATKVKTFTQLVSTIKESVGSGWSATFRTIFGDFEESRTLFSGISQALGGIVSRGADARNNLLQGWKDLGGRNLLIETMVSAFQSAAKVVNTFKDALHEVFPPKTALDLFALTDRFRVFIESLAPSSYQLDQLKRIFVGVFDGIKIGIEVVKGIASVFGNLFGRLEVFKPGSGGALEFFASLGDKIKLLKERLVDGGVIADFFAKLPDQIVAFVNKVRVKFDELLTKAQEIKDKIFDLYDVLSGKTFALSEDGVFGIAQKAHNIFEKAKYYFSKFSDGFSTFAGALSGIYGKVKTFIKNFDGIDSGPVGLAVDKVKERFAPLSAIGNALGAAFNVIGEVFSRLRKKLSTFGQFLKDTFSDVPKKISEALASTDYNQALDTINTGLFAALALAFKKFLGGDTFKFGGIFDNINKALQGLTGTLEAMQVKLKAEALFDIAKAIALLTAAVVVLSLIDSGTLTKAMAALAIGFGQLVVAMGFLNKVVSGTKDAAKLSLVATALITVSGAIILLSIAAKIMATMNWGEMMKGLVGVGLLLGIISVAVIPLSKNSSGMIRVGLGLIEIAIALNIMALAVKSFAELNWADMAKGMVGIAGALVIIAGAINLMPKGLVLQGVGLIAIATALNIMALAVKSFAELNWSDMARGMVGIAGALVVIAGAMRLMPKGLILQGAGLLLIGLGLVSIAKAIKSISDLSWAKLAKGLVGVAGALIILAVAAEAMTGGIVGAAGIAAMALAIELLVGAIKKAADVGWIELLSGIGVFAASVAAIAGASILLVEAVPFMLAFGAALALVGAGFTLFGTGAFLVATAFGIIATSGTAGVATLLSALDGLLQRLPAITVALADGIITLVEKIVAALPEIITSLSGVLQSLFQLLIDNIPLFAETVKTFILSFVSTARDTYPEILAAGLDMLLQFLRGIRDNIGEITTLVADIITNFLDAFALKVPEIIDSVYNLGLAIIKGVIAKYADIAKYLVPRGLELLQGLWDGIKEKAKEVFQWFYALPGNIVTGIGNLLSTLKDKGIDLIEGFLIGLKVKIIEVTNWLLEQPGNFIKWIGNLLSTLKDKGIDLISGFLSGIVEKALGVALWFVKLPIDILSWLANAGTWLLETGKNIIRGLWDGLLSLKDWLIQKVKDLVGWVTKPFEALLNIFSPSRVFHQYGIYIGEGLINGIDSMMGKTKAISTALGTQVTDAFNPNIQTKTDALVSNFQKAISQVITVLSGSNEFNPTITPVLDLSNVERNASLLNRILNGVPLLSTDFSFNQANSIAATSQEVSDASQNIIAPIVKEVKFEQNNYSPTPLSEADIYRNTNNQIALAKEELAKI